MAEKKKVLVTTIRTGRPPILTEDQIDEIVTRYNNGSRQADLAKQYDCSVSTIQKVLRERRPKGAGR